MSLCIVLVTWSLQPIVFEWRQNGTGTGFALWSRIYTTWMRCANLGPVILINRKFDISCKLYMSPNLSTSRSQLHYKATWNFATQSRCHVEALVCLALPKQSSKHPPNWTMKHYETVMFVQISECQAHCTNLKPPIKNFLVTVLLPHKSFSWGIF